MRKISRVIVVSLGVIVTVFLATKDGAFAQQQRATTQTADQAGKKAATPSPAQTPLQQALAELRERLTTERIEPVDFSTLYV